MNTLTKELFISTIESLQEQVCKDIAASNAISQVFDTDAVYDNSLLVKALIKLLQVYFPKDENGFCEIEHYCFDMNFGKIQDQELITAEDLWDRINETKFKFEIVGRKSYDGEDIKIDLGWKWLDNPDQSQVSDFISAKKSRLNGFSGMTSTHPLIDDNPNPDGV